MTFTPAPSRADRYFLGIDGGGSKTLAIIVDAMGHERGRGLAGSSNYAAVGIQQAVSQLFLAAEQAAQAAGCSLPLQAAWLGLAGIDRPEDSALLLPNVQSLAGHIYVTNDAELVLSGLEGAIGVALIAGTGSIALGRDKHGISARAGGWGHILGDEGSGYEIARLALQAAARSADGRGEPTALLDLLLRHRNLRKPEDLIGLVYRDEDKARIAQLSSLVFLAASAGDEIARQIVRHAAHELALAALTVSNALDFREGCLPLALGGGLLIHQQVFRMQVLRRLRHRRPIGPVVMVEQPALSGAHAAIKLSSISTRTGKAASTMAPD